MKIETPDSTQAKKENVFVKTFLTYKIQMLPGFIEAVHAVKEFIGIQFLREPSTLDLLLDLYSSKI